MIELPETFLVDVMAYVGQLFTDTSLIIVMAIGIPVAFWVIRRAISLARAR